MERRAASTSRNQRAFNEGFIPVSLAVYGTHDDPRFAGIWLRNDKPVPWSWWWTDPATYQRFFTAEVHVGTRLSCVSVAPGQRILSMFRDEPIGEWWARHAMTAQDYQHEFDIRTSQGLEPLIVQAGGTGAATRYASLFVRDDHPQTRHWAVDGAAFTGMADFDSLFRQFMSAHAIRALSFAVARNGVLRAQRALTWAEDGYPVTRTQTVMRVASVTKILTCAAIDRLVSDGALSLDTPAFGFLGITHALLSSQTPHPDIGKVTVKQLAIRRSGLQHDFGLDLRGIARRISSAPRLAYSRRAGALHLRRASHCATRCSRQLLQQCVHGADVDRRASQRSSYLDYVRSAVLSPLSINDVSLSATAFDARKPGEVATYDHPGIGPSQVNMADDAVDPNAYGAQVVTENSEGVGGLMMSPSTVARLLATHAVWDIGKRQVARRYGIIDGSMAGAISRDDGLDYAYIFNRRVTDPEQNALTDQLDTLLNRWGAGL